MYLTPKGYWVYCHKMNNKNNYHSGLCYGYEHLKLLCFSKDLEYWAATEQDLEYSHHKLEECFHDFELSTTRLPSAKLVKRYKEMKALYQKICASQSGEEEWFKLLLETNDDAFIKDNVEICLGNYLLNVELWKLYMDYLKQSCQYKSLLEVYSKYCRFFLNDDEMKKEYQNAMLEHGPVYLPWKNLFEFEKGCDMEEVETTNSDLLSPFNCYQNAPLIDFLPKFYRCEAKFIRLPSGIHLSFDELKCLIGHGGVIKLEIYDCILKDEKNECVALEKIMAYLPNIKHLSLNNVKMTTETPHALTSMKFNSKFDVIIIDLISGKPFDAKEFLKFLNVNKTDEPYESIHCKFTFYKEFDADFVQMFEKLMEDCRTLDWTSDVSVDGWLGDNEEED
uniref:Uncharacterized protein n=1 Tax=Panagrolaimus sp. PS1159 TaxID=55785 RepID=A0AC35FS94_9BILA